MHCLRRWLPAIPVLAAYGFVMNAYFWPLLFSDRTAGGAAGGEYSRNAAILPKILDVADPRVAASSTVSARTDEAANPRLDAAQLRTDSVDTQADAVDPRADAAGISRTPPAPDALAPVYPLSVAYRVAVARFHARRGTAGNETAVAVRLRDLQDLRPDSGFSLNILRIPKAGSSHMSMVARSLAGCNPVGMACRNLLCPAVRNCEGHRPTFPWGEDRKSNNFEPSITVFRDPASRLASAFFYRPPHRPPGENFSFEFFREYVQMEVYRNLMTKMTMGTQVDGKNAYLKETLIPTTEEDIATAKTRLCGYAWFGINEWNAASLLLLYQSTPFDRLLPSFDVFGLKSPGNVEVTQVHKEKNIREGKKHRLLMAEGGKKLTTVHSNKHGISEVMRVNSDSNYEIFKRDFAGNGGNEVVLRSNSHDVELYAHARGLFCARARQKGLVTASDTADAFLGCREAGGEKSVRDYCPRADGAGK